MKTIAERLIHLRCANNLTRKEVRDQLGLAESTYRCYESGRRVPDNDMLLKFATFYDVAPSFILGFGELQEETEYFREILEYIAKYGDPDGMYAHNALENAR